MSSLVGNNLTTNNLPPEDLIILSTGSGANKIAASYGEKIPVIDNSEFRFVIDSTNSSQGLKYLRQIPYIQLQHALFLLMGNLVQSKDPLKLQEKQRSKISFIFKITMKVLMIMEYLQMIALQESDVNGLNSGSFQDIFNTTLTEIGSTVRSAEMNASNNEASRDEAKAL